MFHWSSVAPSLLLRHVLFGFNADEFSNIPRVFIYILNVCKFFPWQARNNFRFDNIHPSTIDVSANVHPRVRFHLPMFLKHFRSACHCRFFMSVGCLLCCCFVSQQPSSRSPVILPVFCQTVSAFHLSLLLLCLSLVVYSIFRFLFVFRHSVVVFLSFVLTLSSLLRRSLPFSYSLSIVLPSNCFLWHLCHDVICKGGGVHCPGDFDVHATPFLRHVIYCCEY